MTNELTALLWPASRLGDALQALARESGFTTRNQKPETVNFDLESGSRRLGLEAWPVEMAYADFERQLSKIGHALLRVPGEKGFFAVLASLTVLTPDGKRVAVNPSTVRSALCS